MVSKAKRLPTTTDILINSRRVQSDFYGLNRLRITTKSVGPPPSSGGITDTSSGGGGTGSGLQTVGDSMVGPIAFLPVDADIVSDVIDISPTGNNPSDYSTYVRLLPEGSTDDDLLTINGAAFSGQLLYLQGFQGVTVTLIEGTAVNGGNILTEGIELTITGGQIITLMFDPDADTGDVAVLGAWRVIAGGSATGGALLLTGLTADSTSVGVIPWDNDFFFGDLTKITATATPGVYKLLVGDSYSLEGLLQVEMVDSGGGSDLIFNWQESTSEGGPFTDVIATQSVVGAMEIGKATLTTQPHAIALVDAAAGDVFVRLFSILLSGTFTRTIALSSIAQIETIGTGAGSGGGTGGASTLGQLTDVTLSTPLLNQVLTFNGSLWVNQAPASGGMNQDLSNMADPTTPTVPLKMNGNNIEEVTNILMDVAGTGKIDNVQDLDFFQGEHRIQSFGDRMEYSVAAADSHLFKVGATESVEIRSHGIDTLDIQFPTPGSITANQFEITQNIGTNMNFNVPDLKALEFSFNAVSKYLFTETLMTTPSLVANLILHVNDSGFAAPSNGDISQSGGDVFIGSGGNFVNVTTLFNALAGGGDRIQSPDTLTNIIATDGTLQMKINGTTRWTMNSVNLTLDRSLSLGLNSISDVQNILPNAGTSNIGSASQFFADTHTDRVLFENTSNIIEGSSSGLEYNVGTGLHVWKVGALTPLVLNGTLMQLSGGVNLSLSGTNFTGILNQTMAGSSSILDMNTGDIIDVDDITFQGSGSRLDMNGGDMLDIDDITMLGSGSILNMSGGDILNVDDLSILDDITIGGDLNHDGTRIGFFGIAPEPLQTVSLSDGSSAAEVAGKLNSLIAALFTYGLVTLP